MQYRANHYYDYQELTEQLNYWQSEYSNLMELESIGRTLEGREIWLATITASETGPSNEKPAYWVDGNTHAGEVTSCQASLHTIHKLLAGYAESSEIKNLLQRTTFYVVPRISADGSELFLKTGQQVRSTPSMWDDDDIPENFEECDLTGDGNILGMRIKDPKGRFRKSKKDPRILVPRAPDDLVGDGEEFYSLIPEGKFKNYDGFTKRFVPKYRFDLNRQYPTNFRPEGEQLGAGPYPMYLPEAKAIVKAITERPNIFGLQSFHTFSAIILRPYANKGDLEMSIPDLEAYKAFGRRGEAITGYPCVSIHDGFRYHPKINVGGGFFEWAYEHRGIYAFTNEIWHLGIKAGLDVKKDRIEFFQGIDEEKLLQAIHWCDENLEKGSYFVDWQEFDHPQLGKVEIGGWLTKFTWTNPPKQFLEEEVEKNANFVISCAKAAPQPKIKQIEVADLGENTKKIQLLLENHGFLPTYGSQRALNSGSVRPVRVKAEPKNGLKIELGNKFEEIPHLVGFSEGIPWTNAIFPGRAIINRPNALPEQRLEWVVSGTGLLEVEVDFHRSGVIRKTIEI